MNKGSLIKIIFLLFGIFVLMNYSIYCQDKDNCNVFQKNAGLLLEKLFKPNNIHQISLKHLLKISKDKDLSVKKATKSIKKYFLKTNNLIKKIKPIWKEYEPENTMEKYKFNNQWPLSKETFPKWFESNKKFLYQFTLLFKKNPDLNYIGMYGGDLHLGICKTDKENTYKVYITSALAMEGVESDQGEDLVLYYAGSFHYFDCLSELDSLCETIIKWGCYDNECEKYDFPNLENLRKTFYITEEGNLIPNE